MTRAGQLLGTPAYMSPEQIEAKNIDGRTDVYALGVMLYEMLSGRLPFDATSLMALLAMHLHDAPVPIEHRRPDIVLPLPLRNLVMRCLNKRPDDRPPDMKAVLGELGELKALLGGRAQTGAMPQAPAFAPPPFAPPYTPPPTGWPPPTPAPQGHATPAPAWAPAQPPPATPAPFVPPPLPPQAQPTPQPAMALASSPWVPPPAPTPAPAPTKKKSSKAIYIVALVGLAAIGIAVPLALRGSGGSTPAPSPSPSAPSTPSEPSTPSTPRKPKQSHTQSQMGYQITFPGELTGVEQQNGGYLASGMIDGKEIGIAVAPITGAGDLVNYVTSSGGKVVEERTRVMNDTDFPSYIFEQEQMRCEGVLYQGGTMYVVMFCVKPADGFVDTASERDDLFRSGFQAGGG
jgi:serine/threonine protein kinase